MDFENQAPDPGMEKKRTPELKREKMESQPGYLLRSGGEIASQIVEEKGVTFDLYRANEDQLSSNVIDMISDTLEEAKRPQAQEGEQKDLDAKNDVAIAYLDSITGFHDKGATVDSNSFDKTQRGRGLFKLKRGSGDASRETYWNTLVYPFNTTATRDFAREMLDNKIVVLLGGGRSRLGEEMKECNINPRMIVNIDPFVKDVEEGADPVISMSASDEGLVDRLYEQGIDRVDEIWAEYYVPAYSERPEDIAKLFDNIDKLLVSGGSARIWPAMVKGSEDDPVSQQRKLALIEALKTIASTQKYEILPYEASGRPGFILHKKK